MAARLTAHRKDSGHPNPLQLLDLKFTESFFFGFIDKENSDDGGFLPPKHGTFYETLASLVDK